MMTLPLPGDIELVLLPTDLLVWLIAIGGVVSFRLSFRRAFWRQAWGRIGADGKAMFSLGWLLILVGIALADSVRYRPAKGADLRTLLDRACVAIVQNAEESYASPMAMRGFTTRMTETPEGIRQERPRLAYSGRHVADDEDHLADVLKRLLIGSALGLGFGFAVGWPALLAIEAWRRRFMPGEQRLNRRWRFGVIGFFLMLGLFAGELLYLGHYYHVLGTDKVGNSTLWIALKSIRTAFVIGSLTTVFVTIPAVMFGLLAGYLRGWVDDLVQYLYTTISSIPNILLISAGMLIVQTQLAEAVADMAADQRLMFLCLILAATGWAGLCRLVRGEVLKLREIEYVQGARAMGLSAFSIMRRHLLPNVMHIVLINILLSFSRLVLAEAVLAYIGIGVHPSTQSFGNMIIGAQEQLARSPVMWWNLATAFVFLLILVIPANLFGDAVRDALDPKLRVKI